MILTCPECATSYFVDDSRVGPNGRVVKCSSCGARWTAMPEGEQAPKPEPPPAPPPPAAPPPPPPLDEVVFEAPPAPIVSVQPPRRPAKRPASPVAVWVGAAIAAALLIGAAIVFRAQVVRLLPASEAAYAGLGMPVSSLVIEKVHADATFQGGRPVLQVSGQIRNTGAKTADAPPLKVSLLDWTGKPVAAKVARPIEAPVPGKAIRYFAVTLADPPLSVHDLEVTFAADNQAAANAASVRVPASAAPAAPK